MARVLVTGGAGFIGSALVRRLARRGDEVVVMLRETSDPFRLAAVRDRVRLLRCELFEQSTWLPQVTAFAPERVFHLAWYAEPGKYLTSDQNLEHLRHGIEFVRAMLALRPAQFTITGTCFEYRMPTDVAALVEDSTLEAPRHIYSACKLALKHVALQLARDAGLPLTWARIFYLYGPYEDSRRLVPMLTRALRAGEPIALRSHGRQMRDFLHVDDVARALDFAAGLGRPGVVNIGSGNPFAVRDLAQAIADLFGRPELVTFAHDDTPLDEPMYVAADSRRLRSLGWQPRTPLDLDALRSTDEAFGV